MRYNNMKFLKALKLALAGFFLVTAAHAQNVGTVTNHAFPIGKGAGQTGFTSLPCGAGAMPIGQAGADPICVAPTGDVTISTSGVTAIGSSKVLGAMLGAMTSAQLRAALSDETGTGIAYFVGGALGTPSSATLTNATGLPPGGIAAIAANAVVGNATGGSAVPTAVAPATARSSSLLNVESFTGHGDSIYTILATDRVVGTNAAFTASRTWTLPAASAINAGGMIIVADMAGTVTGSNTLVISRAGSDTINGSTSATINAANGAYALWSDGSSKWSAQAIGAATTAGVSTIGGLSGSVGVANGIEASGANIQITAARRTLPTRQSFTSGSGTYTTPANVLWIKVTIVGAGGGGGGGGTGSSGGSAGGDSCWKASATPCTTPLYQAGGGGLAGTGTNGAGGTVSGSGTCNVISSAGGMGGQQGSQSISGTATGAGGTGGASFIGGGGAGGFGGGGANAVALGSGGGGGSASTAASSNSGAGGGAGAICVSEINSPGASYTYTVGAAGAAANSTGVGNNGGNGAVGYIVVEEFYN